MEAETAREGTKGGNEVIHSVLNYLQDSRKENVVNEETRKNVH